MSGAATTAFIIAMLFWMAFWDAVPAGLVRKYLLSKIGRIFLWLGIDGQWRMFSPNPPDHAIWPMVRMTMDNGDVVRWEATPYTALSVLEKIQFKRFHKFFWQVAMPRSSVSLKRDFMEYLLKRTSHGQACAKAELYLVARKTPPFDAQSNETKPQRMLLYIFYPSGEEGP